MKKILVVDDSFSAFELIRDTLNYERKKEEITIVWESGQDEVLKHFDTPCDIDAVIMDACVPGYSPNTQGLVKEIRKKFSGPIIAASSSLGYEKTLIEAGASHMGGGKDGAAMRALKLLFG